MGENAPVSNPYAPPTEGASRPDLRPDASRAPRPPQLPPGAPAPQDPRRPATPPDPERVRRAHREVLQFWVLSLSSVIATSLPLPWTLGALVLVAAALVVGARALLTTWRAQVPGLLLPMVVVGLAFTAMTMVTLLSTFALWPLVQEREECLRGALTVAAQEECEREAREGPDGDGLDVRRALEELIPES